MNGRESAVRNILQSMLMSLYTDPNLRDEQRVWLSPADALRIANQYVSAVLAAADQHPRWPLVVDDDFLDDGDGRLFRPDANPPFGDNP